MKHILTLLLAGSVSFNILASQGYPPDEKAPKSSKEASSQRKKSDEKTPEPFQETLPGEASFIIAEKTNKQTEAKGHEEKALPSAETEINVTKSQPKQIPADAKEEEKIQPTEEKFILLTTELETEAHSSAKNNLKLELVKNLENTKIGKAVIEGKIEAYKDALNELALFNTPLDEILQKRTSNGKNLIDLMIENKTNREFFTNKIFKLFALNILHILSPNPDNILQTLNDSITQIQTLIKKAKQANNETAVSMFTSLQNLFTQYNTVFTAIKTEHNTELNKIAQKEKETAKQYKDKIKELKEQYDMLAESTQGKEETAKQHENNIKELTKQHQETYIDMRKQIIALLKKYKNRLLSNTGMFVSGGALSLWGYDKLSSFSSASFMSPQFTEFLLTISDKEAGAAALAGGAGLAAIGLYKCYRSIKQGGQIKEQQKQLDSAVRAREDFAEGTARRPSQ